jgi:hypothetical protein
MNLRLTVTMQLKDLFLRDDTPVDTALATINKVYDFVKGKEEKIVKASAFQVIPNG